MSTAEADLRPLTGGTAEEYKPGPLKPITGPLELVDATVRDYVNAARRMGVDPDVEATRRMAIQHLQLVDAYRRGIDVTAQPAAAQAPKPERAQAAAVQSQLKGDDVRVVGAAKPGRRDRPGVLYKPAHKVSDKWSHAAGRLRRITEGITPVFNAAKELDFEASCATAGHPELARRYYRLWGNFMQRHRRSRFNPFAGLSDVDAMRMFEAEVYSICDASSGRFGSWWTPK
jgi:hypothetical protein